MHIKMKVKLKDKCKCGSHNVLLGQMTKIKTHYAQCNNCGNMVIARTLKEVVNGITAVK